MSTDILGDLVHAPAPRTGLRLVPPRLSRTALTACLGLLFLVLSIATVFQFRSEIRDQESSLQADYVIDAYYYVHLGEVANRLVEGDASLSLYDAADSIRPNASTVGVVFLSALIVRFVAWQYLFPLVFAIALYAVIWRLLKEGSSPLLLGLPLCGLFPYFNVPSKEVFFFLGLLGFVAAVLGRRWVWGALMFPVMYLARPEAAMIFAASVAIWGLSRWRVWMALVFLTGIAVYALYLREGANEVSLLSQTLSEQADVGFCSVGPINVCVEEGMRTLELTYLMRLLTLLALPLKWLGDIAAAVSDPTLLGTEVITRMATLTHLGWMSLVLLYRQRRVEGRARMVRNTLLVFAALYWSVYGAVIYFQPTRQAFFACVVLGIALLVNQHASVNPARRRVREAGVDDAQRSV